MKPFLVFMRIVLVGILWGIVFTEGIRVIMLCNWHFDIFWPDHWRQAIALWKAGWVVRAPKEWAFIILLITFIPMLITGWWTLSMVAWEEIIYKIITLPLALYRYFVGSATTVAPTANRYGVVKRKSYKQIRPTGVSGLHIPISDYGDGSQAVQNVSTPSSYAASSYTAPTAASAANSSPAKKTDVAATIDHALFKFDDDDDDFDLDIDSFEKADISKIKPKAQDNKRANAKYDFDSETDGKRSRSGKYKNYDDDDDDFEYKEKSSRNNRRNKKDESGENNRESKNDRQSTRESTKEINNKRRSNIEETRNEKAPAAQRHDAVVDILKQKGYDIIANVKVGTTVIDYVAVAENNIYLCLTDKETGDWLADEEMFNGEDPLWFSESSHRISPVCLLNNAWKKVQSALQEADFEQKVSAYVIIQMANIINADDMFEIWNDMQIYVTRINRGLPKEIRLFSKTIPDAEGKISETQLDKLKKTLNNLQ